MYLYSFDEKEHRRAKRKEKAKRKARRPWKWGLVSIYQAVGIKIKLLRTRFTRERPESEYDRQWMRYGNYMNLKQFIVCMVTVVVVFLVSLVFYSPLLLGMGFSGTDMSEVVLMAPELIVRILYEILARVFKMILLLVVYIFGIFDIFFNYDTEEWKEWIDGCYIRYMDR